MLCVCQAQQAVCIQHHERIGQPLEAHGCHAFTFWQVSRSGALLLSCSAGQADGMVEGCAVWLGMAEG
jgi:hypothetical protein|eukprot:COSAG01_NODE_15677_length_1311_cov_2.247525_1_plen_68_part_00